MFFDEGRLTPMREMIFAEGHDDRAAALDQLLPVQRADFLELFQIMAGKPVTIRLLDKSAMALSLEVIGLAADQVGAFADQVDELVKRYPQALEVEPGRLL